MKKKIAIRFLTRLIGACCRVAESDLISEEKLAIVEQLGILSGQIRDDRKNMKLDFVEAELSRILQEGGVPIAQVKP